MSYNNYSNSTPNYSPYAYQHPANQDGRNQYQNQGSNNAAYSGSSYQPLSAYQSQQQAQPTPQPSNSNTYSGHNYGNITGSGGGGNQAGYTGGRTSVDTTALGNLAYVSSLGRNSPSNQAQNHSSPQSTGGYGISNYGTNTANASYGTGSAQTGSSGSTAIPREDTTRARQTAGLSSSFDYSANSGRTSHQSQRGNPGLSQPPLSAYSFGNQMARPSSGQAVQQPGSRGGSQGVASPTVPPSQAKITSHYRRESTSGYSNGLPNHKSTQKHQAQIESQPRTGTYTPSAPLGTTAQGKARTSIQNQAGSQAPSHNSPYSPAVSAAAAAASRQSNNTPVQISSSQSSTPVSSTFSTTVDPSQVFNQVEYQRKQAEAAKKRVDDAGISGNTPQSSSRPGNRVPSISGNGDSAADEATKAQMELEMKQMLEKMRDYKSKDPSLFSAIWEGVKKGQPGGRAPSQPATQSPSVASPAVANGQLHILTNQLPPESDLPAADSSFPADFDRGRYPAQRRRRGNASFTPDKKPTSKKSKPSPAAADLDPARSAKVGQSAPKPSTSSTPKPSTPSAQQSNSPVTVHVSGKGPELDKRTVSTKDSGIPKANVTYWPEHKKQALADAARATLMKTNVGKNITSVEIHNLLDQNPSYAQMCELLEQRGFVIDRSQFARELLAAVPDLGSAAAARAQPTPPASTATTPSVVSAPPPPQATNRPLPFAPPPGQYNTPYNTPYGPPGHPTAPTAPMGNYGGVNPSRPYDTPEQLQHYWYGAGRGGPPAPPMNGSGGQKPSVTWADNGIPQRTFTPVTKQDLARKRSFGDIVDLTQADSDEEDGEPPAQRKRLEYSDQKTKTSQIKDGYPMRPSNTIAANGQMNEDSAPLVQAVPSRLDDFRYKPNKKEHYRRSLDIIRDMNKRQDAARRSSYNPTSISRDFLLAIGRHPTMDPLNSHLDILRERFRAVDYESDLATFRWDLVDPGGPPLAYETKRALEANDAEQDRNSRPARQKPRIAVVVDDNNVDDDSTLGASAETTSASPKVVRRRGRPSRASLPSPLSQVEQQTPDDSHSDLSRFVYNDLPVMLNNITGENTTTPQTQESKWNAQASSSSHPIGTQSRERVKGRIGRPPGAKNKMIRPDKGVSKTSWSSLKSQRGNHILGQTPDQETSSPEPTPTRSVPSRPPINTTPAKPTGLRNAITPTDGIAVVLPSRSPSVSSIHPRPSSTRSSKIDRSKPSPAPDHSIPAFHIYRCEWENCPAELHNVETLKKHVRKHRHGKKFEAGVACLWRDCYTGDVTIPHLPEVFEGEGGNRYLFNEVEEWDKHVIDGHVEQDEARGDVVAEDADFGATTNGNEVTEQPTISQMSARDWKAPAPRFGDGISVRI